MPSNLPASKHSIQPDTIQSYVPYSIVSNIDSSSQLNKLENSSSSASKASDDYCKNVNVDSNCNETNRLCDSENVFKNENSNDLSNKSCSVKRFNSGDRGLSNDISNSSIV